MFTKLSLCRKTALLCAVLLFALTACSAIPSSTKEENTPVLSIDEYEVPYEQMRYFVRNYMDSRAAGDAEYWTEERASAEQASIYEDCYTSLKNQYAILSLCKKYGIERDNSAIKELTESTMEGIVAQYEDEKSYAADLEKNHLTHQVYTFFTQMGIMQEELYFAMLDAGDLETDEKALHDLIYGDGFVRVKQILIANDAGESPEENRRKAEEAQKRAAAGEDFDKLVKEYGEDLFMFNNTDGYYICRGVWYKEFEDTAFSLKVGEVSPVIETTAGYSVLCRFEKDKAYLDKNFGDLCADYRDAQFGLALEAKAASMKVTEKETLAAYTLLTMD